MTNKHVSLASLFTDTADAIREKTGTNEEIIADNFPDVIREISVGIDTSDATIESLEVMNGEIAYGAEGQIVGTAPFEFVVQDEEKLEYKLVNDELSTNLKLSADNCETVELSVVDNEIVLDSMFIDEETGV